MRQVTPAWKLLTAVFSLLLTVLVWQQGLQESFSRPSVAPKLSLRQHEIAFVASNVLPESFRSVLVGADPQRSLSELFEEIPLIDLTDRERLAWAAIENSEKKRFELLDFSIKDKDLYPVQQALLGATNSSSFDSSKLGVIKKLKDDPFFYQVSCVALRGNSDACVDYQASNNMALRLLGIQIFPIFTTTLGVLLLIRQIWLFFRKKNNSWPELPYIPLTLVDMTLLISGGFVVLGEVLFPVIIIPLSSFFIQGVPSPINESLRVFIGYVAMTIPPLLILRQQLNGLKNLERPKAGWLQWGFKPIDKSIFKAFNGLLMIMPFVLLTGWLMNIFWGDQGGSNPLLDLVLNSNNKIALFLLLTTTVIFAPVFEELIFRGTLLPVLSRRFGQLSGIIISALVFALAHLSVGELPPLFVLGTGLAILRLSSGSLFPCLIMHSLWNGITFSNLLLLAR